jgi:hypothetical protein
MYSDVQFIGYAIPSTPLISAEIGGPDNPDFIEGQYIGIDPAAADIQARIALTMNAIGQTIESGVVDASPSTLKIFVMPEFTFRGKQGAYSHAADCFNDFRLQFAKRVGVPAYEDWLFVFGTIVNTAENYVRGQDPQLDRKARVREAVAVALANAWQFANANNDPDLAAFSFQTLRTYTHYCHAHPIFQVTDRSYVVAGGSQDAVYPEGLSVEKKFISNEDFILNLHNTFPEDDDAYPTIDEQNGEDKKTAFDSLSIFTIKGIKFGLEVCLDHYCARIRCFRKPDTDVVQIQLVPSCGMQIQEKAVIAGAGGYVFNCDGQYGGRALGSRPGVLDSIWTGEETQKAHTQLTQVGTPCTGNDPTCHMPLFEKPDAKAHVVPIHDWTASKLYAYGAGEVHVYTSLPVPPPPAGS